MYYLITGVGEAHNQGVLTSDDISTVTNECYSTSRLPSPTRPRVHQRQDMQLTQNQAYGIPTKGSGCYTTTYQKLEEDYDYVI